MMVSSATPNGNYLRVRGEYIDLAYERIEFEELPPRARRIHKRTANSPQVNRTTSACAENTPQCYGGTSDHGNYLRVRGEYPK